MSNNKTDCESIRDTMLGAFGRGEESITIVMQVIGHSPAIETYQAMMDLLRMDPSIDSFVQKVMRASTGSHKLAVAMALRLNRLGTSSEIDDVIVDSLSDPDSNVRQTALEFVSTNAASRYTLSLSEMLGSSNVMLRRGAARALFGSEDPSAMDVLVRHKAEPDEVVNCFVKSACFFVGKISAGEYLEFTSSRLVRSAEWASAAVCCLARAIQVPGALENLTSFLHHADSEVRWAAVFAVGDARDKGLLRLLDQLVSDPSPAVRSAVATVSLPSDVEGLNRLTSLLRDQNSSVRFAALRTLGRFGWSSASSIVRTMASEDPCQRVRAEADRILARW